MQIARIIIGDLNITINSQENISKPASPKSIINKCIKEWLLQTDLLDVKFSGYPYTWNNHRQDNQLVEAKLDRALANTKWNDIFKSATIYSFTAFGSDHAPILLHKNTAEREYKKPFRVYENWIQQDSCKDVIAKALSQPQQGFVAFQTVLILKLIKK
ncbi:uncharacterized protein LOC113351238 [Papaver somniferum]|uniref:uncharacterized protein LOC113351238 n=1 Tax=Papaver somniferum TaxID=3469 RepID=UPI000E6FAA51|nr:uncharacterized protein LOC113351238 [Papaver somniferum]